MLDFDAPSMPAYGKVFANHFQPQGDRSSKMRNRLADLEHDLLNVQGVTSARVIGDEEPSEIHIVASLQRSPKQVVRDVQSLAAARFGMPIDHRIVSVVQLDEDAGAGTEPSARPVLERVVLASRADSGWVKVALRWPDGSMTEGQGSAGATREARARGATVAVMHALQPVLDGRDSRIEVDHVLINRMGTADFVLVRAAHRQRGASISLVGAALVHDDVATAAVQALLQAVNRRLGSV
jgi:hypothetical protein